MAQDSPNIPLDPDSLRTILGSDNSQCPGCGIVTDVRQLQADTAGNPAAEIDVPFANNSGPGDSVLTSPILSTDKKLTGTASSRSRAGEGNWRVTIRYDDGSYASFDQTGRPAVSKGDRARVVSGRVEPM